MHIVEFEKWVEEFYEKRNWSQYDSFIRLNFLTEEVGEVSRVVRAIEIGRDRPDEHEKASNELLTELTEELGDVLANVIILSQKYDIDLQDIMNTHVEKLSKRFGDIQQS